MKHTNHRPIPKWPVARGRRCQWCGGSNVVQASTTGIACSRGKGGAGCQPFTAHVLLCEDPKCGKMSLLSEGESP